MKRMNKKYSNIEGLLKENLDSTEHIPTKKLMNSLKGVRKKGHLTKEEFVKICMWKSPRPKKQYLKNSEEDIMAISKKGFATNLEKEKITLLTRLKGVSIPTASAILTIVDPKNYGVIDIRVWQLLYLYGSVKVKPTGTNFDFQNWYNYLMQLRYYARKFNVTVRDIERTLFYHHREIQEGPLYKK